MAEGYAKPYFDSSVFIGGLRKEICRGIKRGVVFEYLWKRALDGHCKIYTSALTLTEVYKRREQAHPSEGPILDEFLERVNGASVEIIEIDRETGLRANALCRQYAQRNLYPSDALHLACALRAKCDALLAWDTKLNLVSNPEIRIEEPSMIGKGLFEEENEVATPQEIESYLLMLAREKADREAAARALQIEPYLLIADQAADRIVRACHDGTLPSPFTAKQLRDIFGSEYDPSLHPKLPFQYCAEGERVKMGRRPRFEKVSSGQYVALAGLSVSHDGAK